MRLIALTVSDSRLQMTLSIGLPMAPPSLPVPLEARNSDKGPEASMKANACDLGMQRLRQEDEFESSLDYIVSFWSGVY